MGRLLKTDDLVGLPRDMRNAVIEVRLEQLERDFFNALEKRREELNMNIPCNMTPTASPGRNEGIQRRMIGDLIEEIECQQEAIKQTSRVIWDKLYGDNSVKNPQTEGAQVHIPSYRDRIDNVLEVNRSIMECLESILNGL